MRACFETYLMMTTWRKDMSSFSALTDTADEDVKHIVGEHKEDSAVVSLQKMETEAEIIADVLDDAEERNATTIEILHQTSIATESRDLTAAEYELLARSLRAMTNSRVLKSIAQESGDQTNKRALALEGIKDTLKKFWEFIKSSFRKFWDVVKRWWIKCFDISKRLKSRAKDIMEKADREYGSPVETNIVFPEITKLAMNGKFNEPSLILVGLKNLEGIVEEYVNDNSADRFNDTVEEVTDRTSKIINDIYQRSREILEQNKGDSNYVIQRVEVPVSNDSLTSLKAACERVLASNNSDKVSIDNFTMENSEKYKKQHGEAGDILKHSEYLPGDKWVLTVQPNEAGWSTKAGTIYSLPDVVEMLRRSKVLVTSCRYTDKKYDAGAEVRVLNTTTIGRGCDSVINICEYVFEYRKSFELRDRFKERIIKDIDHLVGETSEDDERAYQQVDRSVRTFANAITGLIRRRSDFETSLCSYAMTSCVSFVNYCEQSLKQYSR